MTLNYSINITSHTNIYTEKKGRNLRIDYTLPQKGRDSHKHINPNAKKKKYDIISSNIRIQVEYSGDLPEFRIMNTE